MVEAQKARLAQLQTIRTAAKDWASTITAVTGALGVVTLIKGPEEIGRLTRGWEIAVGIVLLVAVLSALRGIVLAALAAQGSPRSFSFAPAAYRAHYVRETRLAATQLWVSRVLVVLATIGVIAAVGLTWYGDEEETPATRLFVVTTDGTTACGDLSVADDGTLLVKDSEKAEPASFQPESVRAIVVAAECP